MPFRKIPLVAGQFYHVFNRGIASQPTFFDQRDYQRLMEVIPFYKNNRPPFKYSKYLSLTLEERALLWEQLVKAKDFLVEIVAYSLMPNHFHFLLKQLKENGIRKFIANTINSYTKYFNTKRKRSGPLFQGRFKAVRVENDEQLLYLSRYIHLQPYTSYLVRNLKHLENYPYSSFPEYLGRIKEEVCNKEIILGNFKSKEKYKEFVFDNADYQRKLEEIRHLTLEK